MDISSFRKHAHELVDWMADYMDTVETYPVRAQTAPGATRAQLPAAPPEAAEPFDAIFDDFKEIVVPGMTHWQHPNFFAYFPANSSPPSVLAEMLTATLGAQCMLWQTSPAATEMETHMLDWLRQMTGLPEGFHGVIQDSASSAILCALLTGRERATGWEGNAKGLADLPAVTVYTSEQAHSATVKGARVMGIGDANIRLIETDSDYAMRPGLLAEAIAADKAAGRTPGCVVASLGATGIGAIDPLKPIGEICAEHGVYLHIDAAWAGSAMICPEHRWMLEGIEHVDSFVFNPHKWLFTNFDCSAHFVRSPEDLVRTFAILPEFLKSPEQGSIIDYRDWGVPLGRRFRALKLWFVIRSYGVEGLRAKIRDNIDWTARLAEMIRGTEGFELTSEPRLALLTFRHRPRGLDEAALDALNERLVNAINDDGRIYLTQNRLDGRFVIRISLGQTYTEWRHVEAAWATIQEVAAALTK